MRAVKELARSADRLLRLIDEPLGRAETVLGRLDAARERTGQPVHAELLKLLTHLSYTNDTARQIWEGYETHRSTLRRRLGRDVGARVALFDYLLNVDRRLTNPTIVEFSDYEKTERYAISDRLTGLFNRAHFDDCLKREVNRCRRYGQSASLILLDLDDFKAVNDRYGHPVGDTVLKDVGRLLIQRVRDIDTAARYGGEEFAVILPETPRARALVVAERIRTEVQRSFRRRSFPGRETGVTITGGISAYPEDGETAETLVARADDALYQAKRKGKNRVGVYYREKRRASRYNLDPASVRVQLDTGRDIRERACRALNISETGVLLESDKPLRVGQSLDLRILSGDDHELNLQGEVVRLEEKLSVRRRKVYGAGVKFRFGRRSLPQALTRFLRAATAAEA